MQSWKPGINPTTGVTLLDLPPNGMFDSLFFFLSILIAQNEVELFICQ